MLTVVMLAMMLAVAAPAFADTVVIDEGDDIEYDAAAQNIIGSVGDITQNGTAEAEDDSVAAASVDQAQDLTISQSNVFGNGFFFPFFWDWWF